MFTRFFKYFQQPYPYAYNNKKYVLIFLVVIVLLSFLFSYAFDPFEVNVDEHKIDYFWILWIHAALPLPIAFCYFYVFDFTVKDDSRWTLGKEIILLFTVLILIGIGSFLVRDIIYNNPNNWSWHYFIEEVRNSFLVGALLLFIVLPLNLERLIKKHQKTLASLRLKKPNIVAKTETIQILLGQETFKLDINEFLFAKVESNYTEIYTYNGVEVKKELFRITLKELENHLNTFPTIYKTHRSYLVNLSKITACQGNAQGYQLTLQNYEATVPVSRSKLTDFNTYFSKVL